MTNDEFFKSLSDADWDKAEAIETEIGELLQEGFTEEVGIKFVRTVMAIRAVMPEATVGGIFDRALSVGLSCVTEQIKRKRNSGDKRGSKKTPRVRGV